MNVLITGAASGMGAEAARIFTGHGHSVYSVDARYVLERERFTPFTADIRDEDALTAISSALAGTQLDAIICCAGIHDMMSFVETDLSRFKTLMDIDLMGTANAVKAFYPLLKADGRVIIVTSEVAYLDPMPFNGGYSVAKTALECYAQALRQELNLLNHMVITLRFGAVDTPLSRGATDKTALLADETHLYRRQAASFVRIAKRFMGTPLAPEKAAAVIYKAATAPHPRLIYKKHRNIGLVLMNLMPKRAQLWLIKTLLNQEDKV
ncbi:MAG: SDR family NAD(P)-dependent oxidoreductase [Clostridia bacterium]|nr:SDR family NAD(P)-dependent oxidoreductase [Clostridia bacterium]